MLLSKNIYNIIHTYNTIYYIYYYIYYHYMGIKEILDARDRAIAEDRGFGAITVDAVEDKPAPEVEKSEALHCDECEHEDHFDCEDCECC